MRAAIRSHLEAVAAREDPTERAHAANDAAAALHHLVGEFVHLRMIAMRELQEQGWSLGDLAQEFGLTRARIAKIADGEP